MSQEEIERRLDENYGKAVDGMATAMYDALTSIIKGAAELGFDPNSEEVVDSFTDAVGDARADAMARARRAGMFQ